MCLLECGRRATVAFLHRSREGDSCTIGHFAYCDECYNSPANEGGIRRNHFTPGGECPFRCWCREPSSYIVAGIFDEEDVVPECGGCLRSGKCLLLHCECHNVCIFSFHPPVLGLCIECNGTRDTIRLNNAVPPSPSITHCYACGKRQFDAGIWTHLWKLKGTGVDPDDHH